MLGHSLTWRSFCLFASMAFLSKVLRVGYENEDIELKIRIQLNIL